MPRRRNPLGAQRTALAYNQYGHDPEMPLVVKDLRSLARNYTEQCVRALSGIVASNGSSDSARVAAATELLNRGWGRPKPEETAEDGQLTIVIRRILETGSPTPAQSTELPAIEGEILPPEKGKP